MQDHNEFMKAVNEKGKLVAMMENCGTEDKLEVQEQIRSLNLRWNALQVKAKLQSTNYGVGPSLLPTGQ